MTDARATSPDTALSFGPFLLYPHRKLLIEAGKPVRLGSRAMDLLIVLVDRAGDVVSREELESYVWPRTVVEATSLRVHISALRKALGDGGVSERYILNVPGRGYSFVMAIKHAVEPSLSTEAVPKAAPAVMHNLPIRLSKVIGRSDAVSDLHRHLEARRFVSIVGAGGMGKTTVALAVAEERLANYVDGVWFVDLAPLTDAALVSNALASVLGISLPARDPLLALRSYLAERRMLIVLDNCEHVIDGAAQLTEHIARSAPDIHLLTTSREPLKSEGEWVYRLAALGLPDVSVSDSLEQAIKYPALQLFIERATADNDRFAVLPDNYPLVAHLCQQLDGMPLAIELAAGRIDSLGLRGLVNRLDDMFRLLRRGRRTALPRHQTLQALLDWSHDLLNEFERIVLRRLSVFSSSFALESAISVVSFDHVGPSDVIDSLASLAAKSLVVTDTSGNVIQYRLLSTTRIYAKEKLEGSGEARQLARRHAQHFQAFLDRSRMKKTEIPRSEWMAIYGTCQDDVRAGLDWAFSPGGDDLLGVMLTCAALELTYELDNFDIHLARVKVAMEAMRRVAALPPVLELRLLASLCFSNSLAVSSAAGQEEIFTRITALIEETNSPRYTVEALYSMCTRSFGSGDYRRSKEVAARIGQIAEHPYDPSAKLLSDRFMMLSCHYLGEHQQARAIIERVLEDPVDHPSSRYYHQISPQVSMRIMLARILWIQGLVDQAVVVAERAVELSVHEHPSAYPYAMAFAAVPIAIWRGDARAELLLGSLGQYAVRYSQSYWQAWHRVLHMGWAMHRRPMDANDVLSALKDSSNPVSSDMLATLCTDLVTVDSVLRAESGMAGWCAPEVLRAQAESLYKKSGPSGIHEAEAILNRALQLAQQQRALSWELRCAHSLARLWSFRGNLDKGQALLARTLNQFSEGAETADHTAARLLMRELESQLASSVAQHA